jgi:5'-nucleotidase / UDP-sugar diphosphatase
MIKHFISFFILVFNFSVSYNQNLLPDHKEKHIVILHTNDHHGHPLKFDYLFMKDVGGLPARATLINEIRKNNPDVLVIDAGDLNSGMAISNYFHAEPDIIGYNYIGYDAMEIGNHEFDVGIDMLKKQVALAKFPFICANIKIRHNKKLIEPFIIKKTDGISVAIFGLLTEDTKTIGNPQVVNKIRFTDEIKVAKRLVPKLRKKANIVIALTHLGENSAYRLASEVRGIDVIIDGHSHSRIDTIISGNANYFPSKTIIAQAWYNGLVLGKVDLWLRNDTVYKHNYELIPINLQQKTVKPDGSVSLEYINKPIKEDTVLSNLLEPYKLKTDSIFAKTIGYTAKAISFDATNNDENIGHIISESMLWYARDYPIDFSVINQGCIRNQIPQGNISMNTIFSVLPFDNSLCIVTLKGHELIAFINSISTIPNNKGAFPIFSDHVKFQINKITNQVENISVHEQKIDPRRKYHIITNSYLAMGGDNYKVFKNARHKTDLAILQRDALIQYIKSKKTD